MAHFGLPALSLGRVCARASTALHTPSLGARFGRTRGMPLPTPGVGAALQAGPAQCVDKKVPRGASHGPQTALERLFKRERTSLYPILRRHA